MRNLGKDIDQTGKIIADRPRLTGERLDCYYWIPSPVIHPSTMMRSDLASRLRYDNTVGHVEDFDLWLRTVKAGYKLHNLAEYLLLYRVHQKSMSYSILEKQLYLSYECLCRHVSPDKMSYEAFLTFFQDHTISVHCEGPSFCLEWGEPCENPTGFSFGIVWVIQRCGCRLLFTTPSLPYRVSVSFARYGGK